MYRYHTYLPYFALGSLGKHGVDIMFTKNKAPFILNVVYVIILCQKKGILHTQLFIFIRTDRKKFVYSPGGEGR